MRITPLAELEHRCSRLRLLMEESGIDAVLVLQNADLFYFTGTVQNGVLYIPVSGDPVYLVRKDFMRARMESGLKEVVPFASLRELPGIIAGRGLPVPKRIGLELDVLPVNLYDKIRALVPDAHYLDASPCLRRVRMIKSHYEIHILQDAADQVDKVYRRVRGAVREGMTDLELAAELDMTARREGHQGILRMRAFNGEIPMSHVLSGGDAAVPSYGDTPLGGLGITPALGQGAGLKRIERNEPIVVDLAGCYDGYMVDQTRIFALGDLPARFRTAYDDMVKIQSRMVEMAPERPTWGEIYDECRAMAVAMGYGDNFMGYKGAQTSFIGHGVGVEVDEYPFLALGFHHMRLEPGMVFAFEPKVVFPGEGAVGIENTFYLTESGLKRLTHSDDGLVIL